MPVKTKINSENGVWFELNLRNSTCNKEKYGIKIKLVFYPKFWPLLLNNKKPKLKLLSFIICIFC